MTKPYPKRPRTDPVQASISMSATHESEAKASLAKIWNSLHKSVTENFGEQLSPALDRCLTKARAPPSNLADLIRIHAQENVDHNPLELFACAFFNGYSTLDTHHDMETRSNEGLIVEAFHSPFVGNLHMVFLRAIATFYESFFVQGVGAYGRTVHVVQSSGTGKSKLLKEVCDLLPGLSVCLRPQLMAGSNKIVSHNAVRGYPYGDDLITDFLTTLPDMVPDSAVGHQAVASAFIAMLLEQSALFAVSPAQVNSFWRVLAVKRSDFDAIRVDFLEKVVDSANKKLADDKQFIADLDKKLVPSEAVAQELHHRWCEKPARQLASRIASANIDLPTELGTTALAFFKSKPTFFFGIDEASMLDLGSPENEAGTRSSIKLMDLRRAVLAFATEDSALRLWTVLIDTYSGITEVPSPAQPSARLPELPPLPPFVTLPFDVLESHNAETANDFLHFSHLKQLGRPLWATAPDYLLARFARNKLLCGSHFDVKNHNHVIAVFSNILWLDLLCTHGPLLSTKDNVDQVTEPMADMVRNDKVVQLAQEGVRRHMRIFRHMDPPMLKVRSRGGTEAVRRPEPDLPNDAPIPLYTITTTVASEPALALGALLALSENNNWTTALKTLISELVSVGTILAHGEIGEFLARLLLVLARVFSQPSVAIEDGLAARRTSLSGERARNRRRVSTIPLSVLLKTLLGPQFGLKNADDVVNLSERLEGCWVGFTHFTRLCERVDSGVTTEDLQEWWSRSAALVCYANQSGIDLIIPVYKGDPDAKLDQDRFTYLGIQCKLKAGEETTPRWRATGKFSAKSTGTGSDIRPITCNVWGPPVLDGVAKEHRPLVIIMDLGLSAYADSSSAAVDLFCPRLPDEPISKDRNYINLHATTAVMQKLMSSPPWGSSPTGASAVPSDILEALAQWMGQHQPTDLTFAALHVRGFDTDTYPVLQHVRDAVALLQQLAQSKADPGQILPPGTDEMGSAAETWSVGRKR
ncbi:hypothetical protein BCV70DRAFT_36649 [Testicularia cyperi]|uniref:Uncharacterized protein n=1 Tax=Testicularia cyperi TaxID=1882483 RepID=A0A317XIY8_9BASI|nr:hypothetical protein BCV70DRAFT_36649 [Testicularia cyperi]